MPTPDPRELLLPSGTRLVHIGAPKAGSTALQNAASTLRAPLLEHGVRYPGHSLNHQRATSVLIRRPAESWGGGVPPEEWWTTFKKDMEADDAAERTLVSFECICQGDADGVRRVRDEFGEGLHVTLVLRNFGSLLPSMWQQMVKMGSTRTLDGFLKMSLADPRAPRIPGTDAFHRADGRNLVERWAEIVGPDRITVIVLEKSAPDRLFDTFEGMLGLPAGLLATAPSDGQLDNRSLTAHEAELVRVLNERVLNDWQVARTEHRNLIWMGAVDRMLANRTPEPDEPRIALPEWAAERAVAAGTHLADALRASGVRVIGDVAELERPVRTAPEGTGGLPPVIPTDAAVEALLGMFTSATGRNPDGTRDDPSAEAPVRPEPSRAPRGLPRGAGGPRRLARKIFRKASRALGRGHGYRPS